MQNHCGIMTNVNYKPKADQFSQFAPTWSCPHLSMAVQEKKMFVVCFFFFGRCTPYACSKPVLHAFQLFTHATKANNPAQHWIHQVYTVRCHALKGCRTQAFCNNSLILLMSPIFLSFKINLIQQGTKHKTIPIDDLENSKLYLFNPIISNQ